MWFVCCRFWMNQINVLAYFAFKIFVKIFKLYMSKKLELDFHKQSCLKRLRICPLAILISASANTSVVKADLCNIHHTMFYFIFKKKIWLIFISFLCSRFQNRWTAFPISSDTQKWTQTIARRAKSKPCLSKSRKQSNRSFNI